MKMLSLRFLPVPLFLLALAAGLAPHSQAQSVEVAPVSTIRAVAGQQTIRTLDDPASARILDPSIATVAAADGHRVVVSALAPGRTFLTYRTTNAAPVSEVVIVAPPL